MNIAAYKDALADLLLQDLSDEEFWERSQEVTDAVILARQLHGQGLRSVAQLRRLRRERWTREHGLANARRVSVG